MRKLAIILCLLLIFPAPTLAQKSNDSPATAASDDCAKLAKACVGAARELKAARELIAGYEAQSAAADARIELALKQIDSLRKLQMLSEARAQELETVIAAERKAKAKLFELKAEQEKRVAALEKKLSRSRRTTLIVAAVAVVVGVLLGARR